MSDPAVTVEWVYDEREITAADLRRTLGEWLRERSKPVDHFGRALSVASSVPKPEPGLFFGGDVVGARGRAERGSSAE
jgi:hypothetical protein